MKNKNKETAKKGKMTKEEFEALPEDRKNEILEKRELAKAKNLNKASIDLDVMDSNLQPTDREYNATFNRMYKYIRQAMVVLRAKKVTGQLTGKSLYDETVMILDRAKEL